MHRKILSLTLIFILCIDSRLTKCVVASGNAEDDPAFVAFLSMALRNYTNWLAARDPTNPIVQEINLESDKNIHPGVDAHLSIQAQYMSGHSKSYRSVLAAVSDIENDIFSITRGVDFKEPFLIGGNYKSNGTVQTWSKNINFNGSGEWKLYSNETFQHTVFKYTLNETGYIDIDPKTLHYLYDINWTLTEFHGLKVIEDDNSVSRDITENEVVDRIKSVLAQMYKSFLNNYREYPYEVNPPKGLLFEYFRGIFSETKLLDMLLIGGSYRTTTPPNSDAKNAGLSIRLENTMLVTLFQIFFSLKAAVLR